MSYVILPSALQRLLLLSVDKISRIAVRSAPPVGLIWWSNTGYGYFSLWPITSCTTPRYCYCYGVKTTTHHFLSSCGYSFSAGCLRGTVFLPLWITLTTNKVPVPHNNDTCLAHVLFHDYIVVYGGILPQLRRIYPVRIPTLKTFLTVLLFFHPSVHTSIHASPSIHRHYLRVMKTNIYVNEDHEE